MKKGFTLLETMIILVIIGTLAALAWPAYVNTREEMLKKDAWGNLRYLQAAEKKYHMSHDKAYYPLSDSVSAISQINDNLTMNMPEGGTPAWTYTVYSTGCVQAQRNLSAGDIWHLHIGDEGDPQSGGCQQEG
jgi:prepilin-type N-terminal cleavage/methylation domain-containing protein